LGRDKILQRIRSALGESHASEHDRALLDARMDQRPSGPKVALGAERMSQFLTKVVANNFTVERLASQQLLDSAVRALIPDDETPDISVAKAIQSLGWPADWKINYGPGRHVERLCVTQALAGIAETGSVVVASAPDNPTTLNFLPDMHVIVLRAEDVVDHPEDVWARMALENWPRAVNVISGPSRTADVGGIIVRPAHGPKRVHLIVIDA